MAHESDKSPAELEKRVWQLVDGIKFCMFTTWNGEKQHQRPLTAMHEKDDGQIYFLVDEKGSKNWEAEKFPEVSLAFVDPGKHDYLTITGRAAITNDREKIKALWTPFAKAWWDSADDPSIRLLTVTPSEAEIWDGPNRLVAGAIMLAAAATKGPPPIGEHAHVKSMRFAGGRSLRRR